MVGKPLNRGRGVVHDFGAAQAERPGAFRKVPVVADVNADLRVGRPEHRIPQVAGAKEVLLPEAGGLRYVRLAVLAEVAAVRVDDRRRVVENAGVFLLVQGNHDHHGVPAGVCRDALRRGSRDGLGGGKPRGILTGAEIRRVEYLLQAKDLNAPAACFLDERNVPGHHAGGDFAHVSLCAALGQCHLDEAGPHRPRGTAGGVRGRHQTPPASGNFPGRNGHARHCRPRPPGLG